MVQLYNLANKYNITKGARDKQQSPLLLRSKLQSQDLQCMCINIWCTNNIYGFIGANIFQWQQLGTSMTFHQQRL